MHEGTFGRLAASVRLLHGKGMASIDPAHRLRECFRLRQRAEVTNQPHLVIGTYYANLKAQRAAGSDHVLHSTT